MMTDCYYELFKGEVEKTCGERAAELRDLQRQVAGAAKRLTDERDAVRRLQDRIERLRQESGKSLTGNKNAYERYRSDLTKRSRDLDTSRSMVESLEQLLKKKQVDVNEAESNLKIVLRNCVVEHRHAADTKIEELLRAALDERDAFLDGFRRIFADFGQSFVANTEELCPGVWAGDEVENLRSRLAASEQRRACRKALEVSKSAQSVQDAPTEATETPQIVEAEQSPLEPAPDTPDEQAEPVEPEPVSARQRASGAIPTEQTTQKAAEIPFPAQTGALL